MLPGWFSIHTPLGAYNPDWAVVAQTDAGERLYLVVETKSSLFAGDLRDAEAPAQYVVQSSVAEMLAHQA